MSERFDRKSIQAMWSKAAGNDWRKLQKSELQSSISGATRCLFYNIIDADDPSTLVGERCGGTLYAVCEWFEDRYYCGFAWQGKGGGFLCRTNKNTRKYVIESVYIGDEPPTDRGVSYAAAA